MATIGDFMTDRIIGCLLAGAVGDAWGSSYEGMQPPVDVELERDWLLTDDTQLTLATCRSIVATGGIDPERIAAEMVSAHRAGSLVGVGASTYQALESLAAGGHWALVGRKGESAAGNGAAMRVAPLAFFLDDLDKIPERRLLRDVCRITHHNDEAYIGALAVALAIRAACRDAWDGGPGLIAHVAGQVPDSKVRDRMLELARVDPAMAIGDVAREFGNSGYVVESVPLALFSAEQVHRTDFTSWLRGIIAAGGDADTIASMAAQVAGSHLGSGRIPADLVAGVPGIEQIRATVTDFAAAVRKVKGRQKDC